MDQFNHLLPDLEVLKLQNWRIEQDSRQIIVEVSSVQLIGQCPICLTRTQRIHSHYQRTLADLPWADYSISLHLQVRKFFCSNRLCQRRIFTERIPTIAAPWARRTDRFASHLTTVGLMLGGAPGARLGRNFGYQTSCNTLLRLVSALPLPDIVPPHTLGVDDFAFRKRQSYGTILVDLEQGRPIALLKDCEASTLADWLHEHPGIKVLSRDRSVTYKIAMTNAAPDAVQVADRFHLLQNLAEVLKQFFGTHRQLLTVANTAHRQGLPIPTDAENFVTPSDLTTPEPIPSQSSQQLSEHCRQQRLHTYQKTWLLHDKGWSSPAIAKKVGVSARTVQRFLKSPTFPERLPRSDRGRSLLNPYKDYISQQWHQGRRCVKDLFKDILQQGFSGSYMTVVRYTHLLSQSLNIEPRKLPIHRQQKVSDSSGPPLTPSRATWLVFKKPEQLKSDEQDLLARLVAQHPDLALAIGLTQDFVQLIRQRQPEAFDSWLQQAQQSNLAPFQRFAQGLQQDYDAIVAAMTLPVSNGPVEGHINRLKMLKRQMFGRASLELLARRFLLTP